MQGAAGGHFDFLDEGGPGLTQIVMELEVTEHLGTGKHQRSSERTGYRNGYRERQWDTQDSTVHLQMTRVRCGRFFPGLLDPRTWAE